MAADLLGAMRVEIVGDNSKLDKSIKESEKKTEKFGKSTAKLGANLGKLFAGIGFALVVKKIADIGKAVISAASDAEETRNKFNVVFASVADAAAAASLRIQDEFKLSESTTENFLSGVGDITSGLGATSTEALLAAERITSLGLDIDSFANLTGGASQAVSALTSLFTGEREAAKALGIVINDNNLKQFAEDSGLVFKELTPLEKGFLSLELATTQSQLAIGDFARSQESFANQSKIASENVKDLSVELGQILLPAATKGIGIFSDLTEKITELAAAYNDLREANKALEDGTATLNQFLVLEQNTLKNNKLALDEVLKGTEREIGINKEFIESKKVQIATSERIIKAFEDEIKKIKEKEQAEGEAAKAKDKNDKLEIEAKEKLAELTAVELTQDEQQLENLRTQINFWDELRGTVEGAEEVFQALAEERNKLNKKIAEETEKTTEEILEAKLKALEREAETTEEVLAKRIELELQNKEAIEEFLAAEVLATEEAEEKKRAARQQTIDLITGSLSVIDQLADNAAQAELDRLEKNGASEEELDAKKKELAKENAKREKAIGIFDIAVNTASAIVKAFAQLGPIGGAIATGFITALGIAQTAAVLSAPLPKFAGGGVVAGSDFVGDRVPTLQNSGEMNINRQQQQALWRFIQGGSQGITNNNNSSNINITSMFSLGNDAKLNQAAEALFPALQKVGRRRGASIGGIG